MINGFSRIVEYSQSFSFSFYFTSTLLTNWRNWTEIWSWRQLWRHYFGLIDYVGKPYGSISKLISAPIWFEHFQINKGENREKRVLRPFSATENDSGKFVITIQNSNSYVHFTTSPLWGRENTQTGSTTCPGISPSHAQAAIWWQSSRESPFTSTYWQWHQRSLNQLSARIINKHEHCY